MLKPYRRRVHYYVHDIMKGFCVKITIHHKCFCLLQDSQMAQEKGNIDFVTQHLINRISHLAICGKEGR